MSNQRFIAIVTDAELVDCRRVWDAQGLGPENFLIKICAASPGVTWETPPTHHAVSDAQEPSMIAAWQAMAYGVLPEIFGVWGEDGVIDEASAIAATAGDVLQVYTGSGEVNPQEHLDGILYGRGLMQVPEKEP